MTPASTFKIPNAAIALETGVADGPGFALPWDPARDPRRPGWPAAWAGPQTLRSAFRESCVWYFQELARRIGVARMSGWLRQFGYGSAGEGTGAGAGLPGPIDRFWLDGSLTISADEQAAFLERLLAGRLGLSGRTAAAVRELALLERTEGAALFGKTGTAAPVNGVELGWLVGWVESGGRSWVYALNVEAPVAKAWSRSERVEKARQLLAAAGVPVPAAAKSTSAPR